MGKLIKSEFIKLSKSFGYKILLISVACTGILGGSIVSLLAPEEEINGFFMYANTISETQMSIVFTSIFAAIFIGNEFSHRTFGIGITSGCSRRDLLLSKTVVFLVGMASILILCPVIATAIVTVVRGFGVWNDDILKQLIGMTLRYFLGNLALGGFCILFAVWIKSIGGIIGAELGLLLLISSLIQIVILAESQIFRPLLRFTFLYQLATVAEPESVLMFIAVSVITFAVTLAVSLFIFERSELK